MLINEEIKKIEDLFPKVENLGILTVDPGIGGTGLAAFKRGVICKTELITPSSGCENWFEKCLDITNRFEDFVEVWNPEFAIIEFPGLWSGSATSQASAAKGDLFKLTMLIGMLVQTMQFYEGGDRRDRISLVSPQQWKGQMSKAVVDRRIKRAINQEFPNHVGDAVGIGLALMGKL